MENSSSPPFSFKITPNQATLVSFVLVMGITAVSLILAIGYRDSRLVFLPPVSIVVALVGYAIFRRPQLGGYLLIITLFTNMSSVFTDSGLPSINKPLVVFVLGVIILNHLIYKRPFPRFGHVELLLLAYGFVWFLSVLGAGDQYLATEHVIDFAKDFIIVITIIMALEEPEHWKTALWLVVIAAGILGAMSTYQILTGNFDQIFGGFAGHIEEQVLNEVYQIRIIGPLADPNFYGLMMVMVAPIAIYFFLEGKRTSSRLVAVVAALLIIFTVLNTYSRGDFIALILVLGLIGIERRLSPTMLVGVGLGVLLLIPFLPSSFNERMLSLVDLGSSGESAVYEESSFRGRSSEYISGMLMFLEHPVLGVGVGNYEPNYQKYSSRLGLDSRTEEREAHSLYIETLAETGSLGIIALSSLLIVLFSGMSRARKKLEVVKADPEWVRGFIALQMGLIAFLIASIFLHGAYIRYLWLLIALGAAGINIAKEKEMIFLKEQRIKEAT